MNKKNHAFVIFLVSVLTGFGLSAQAQFIKGTTVPADTTFNVPRVYRQIKNNYPQAVPAKDSIPAGVIADRDLVYAHLPETSFGPRDLHVDLFRPEKAGKYPALILVHGGGWRAGDKSLQVPMAQMIAQKGFVAVAVEYQLSLEAKYPAAVHNIKAAIRWLRANADEFNIDPDFIAISGCSAGGQLAALVGMTNGVNQFEGSMGNNGQSSAVQAVIDIDGVLDFMAPLSLNLDRRPDSPDVQWLEGDFYTRPDRWKEASPIFWLNENSVPVLFLNSGFPRFTAGQYEMISMMERWGIYHELHKFDVQIHPFWLFHPWVDETVTYMVEFMRKVSQD
ncbi:alpha/beta hydrolase [Gaoshiqia sediminis]|uniref:Alpha/beta hydrolase n=1 Tax=Gaoshiqia sediminis TaxID=2986998 RepID=A0AA42C785_9BACT|nr:alpha/beta hydrolase [Gaoshiqia sediminis]MCW0481321.1 alpha/beta hydrolase [Gaoshiqia sediminis]